MNHLETTEGEKVNQERRREGNLCVPTKGKTTNNETNQGNIQ